MTLARKVALNATALAAGRLLRGFIGVASVAVAARYLGTEGFGELVTAIAFTTILATVNDWGLSTAGARELARSPENARRISRALMTLALTTSIGAAVLAVAAAFLLYPGEEGARVREAVALLMFGTLPLSGAVTVSGAHFIAQQRAWITMLAGVTGSVATIGVLVLTIGLDLGYLGVVAAYVASGVGYGIVMLGFSIGRIPLLPSLDREMLRDLVRWALPIGAGGALLTLYWKLDVMILSILGTSTDVALYGAPFKVIDAVIILPTYFLLTLMPELARTTVGSQRLRELVTKSLRVLEVIAIALLAGIGVLAPEIVAIVGGPRFVDAAPVLRILAVGLFLSYLIGTFAQAFISLGHEKLLMRINGAAVVFNGAANVALIPVLGMYGAAIAFVLTEALVLAISLVRFGRISELPQMGKTLQLAAAGGVMVLVLSAKHLAPLERAPDPVVVFGLGGVAGVAYVAALYALRAMPAELHAGLVRPLLDRLHLTGVLVRRAGAGSTR